MSSRMRLRSTIRAPARFGEAEVDPMDSALYHSIRAAREKATKKPKSVQPVVSNKFHRPVPAKPSSVPFDPTLPSVAFPSLGFGQRPVESPDATCITDWSVNSKPDDPIASLPLGQLDNYVASNNESNPVYVKNMEIFASLSGDDSARMFEDSDLDEPRDASEVLGAKIPNPSWNDIHPALQVEIVQNIKQTSNFQKYIAKLDLVDEDARKFRVYARSRDKQIRRENTHLAKMRNSQLQHLLSFDNSDDIKCHSVPHQLVLRRSTRNTLKVLRDSFSESHDLLMCQAADVLAARQFLNRRGLPKSFAGDWSHGMVELQQQDEDETNIYAPEVFKWKEDLIAKCEAERAQLCTRTRYSGIPPARANDPRTRGFHKYRGPAEGTFVNPQDLCLRNDSNERQHERRRYYPTRSAAIPNSYGTNSAHVHQKFRSFSKGASKSSIRFQEAQDQSSGPEAPHRLNQTVPYIHPLASAGTAVFQGQVETIREVLDDTPTRLPSNPMCTCSERPALKFADISLTAKRQLPHEDPMPVTRLLVSKWPIFAIDHTIAQKRFQEAIEEARTEAMRARERERDRREEEEERDEEMQKIRRSPMRAGSLFTGHSALLPVDVFTRDESFPILDDFFTEHWSGFPRLKSAIENSGGCDPLMEKVMGEWLNSDWIDERSNSATDSTNSGAFHEMERKEQTKQMEFTVEKNQRGKKDPKKVDADEDRS